MFEIKTILLFSFSLKAFLGVLLFVFSLKNISFKPTLYVALGNIISGIGLLIHSFYPFPNEVLNLLLLNTSVIFGDGLFLVGLWVLRGKKINSAFLGSLLVISLVQVYIFTSVWRFDGIRVAINSLIYSAIGFYVLNEFSFLLKKRLRPLYFTIGIIMVTHCTILIIRAISVFNKPSIDLMAPNPIGVLMHLYIVLAQTSAVFCYVILVNQLLREELDAAHNRQAQLQSFKDDLTSMIVHDLKVPLNSLISPPPMYDGEKYGNYAKNMSYKMLTLVSNILDVNKYGEEKIPIHTESFNLNNALEFVLDQLKGVIEQKSLRVKIESLREIQIVADKDLLERILANLISNAVKFSPDNDTVIINVHSEESYLKISVTDCGQGIDPAYHSMIFTKYGQVLVKNIGISRSTGLGLTFCKMAVEAHGGTMGIVSSTGNGSTFWFTLPWVKSGTDLEPTSIIKKTEQQPVILSKKDKAIVSTSAQILLKTEIFELSKIKNQLDTISDYHSPEIKEWKEKIYLAALNNNEARFVELVDLALK